MADRDPTNVEQLALTLARLDAQIEAVEVVDPKTRELLDHIKADIQFLLDRDAAANPPARASADDAVPPPRLSTRLSEAVVRLEGKRPKLVATLRSITELLDDYF